jgi:hypothetical protein
MDPKNYAQLTTVASDFNGFASQLAAVSYPASAQAPAQALVTALRAFATDWRLISQAGQSNNKTALAAAQTAAKTNEAQANAAYSQLAAALGISS